MNNETFWDRYITACKENSVKPREVARELSVAPATVTRWKNGSTPNDRTIRRIAERLKVSFEYLSGKSEDEVSNHISYNNVRSYGVGMNYERFEEKCREAGYTPTSLLKGMDISSGNLGSWKNGGNPSIPVLKEIAKRLRCSLDYLLGVTDYSLTTSDIADEMFINYNAVPDRVASLKAGTAPCNFERLVKYLHCTQGFLLNDDHISYNEVFSYENYSKAVPSIAMEYIVMEYLDRCANTLDYRIIQIQISRVILFWTQLITYLLQKPFEDTVKCVSAEKIDFLLTGKEYGGHSENYGLNLSDLLNIYGRLRQIYRGINLSLLFSGLCGANDVKFLNGTEEGRILTVSENNIARFSVPFPDIAAGSIKAANDVPVEQAEKNKEEGT